MKAVKGNKEYSIDDAQQKSYQDGGFDIKDDAGNIIAYGRGKTVPFEDHMAAVKEIERLQALCADLQDKNARLEKEMESAKAEKKPKRRKKPLL